MRLNTSCLAELLDLSIDHPKNFFSFNVKEAEEKLNQVSVIKQARVEKIQPGIVHVNYVLRKPIALLGDFTNTALDADGITFPIKPFFTPKKLPEIYLGHIDGENQEYAGGCKGPGWGKALTGRRAELALLILDLLTKNYGHPLVHIASVDVSKAFASSCGERQIVVVLEELIEEQGIKGSQLRSQSIALRLGTDNYEKQLENYSVLQKHLWTTLPQKVKEKKIDSSKIFQPVVIDLRLSNLAFIEEDPI
jgi:hypothetical protein